MVNELCKTKNNYSNFAAKILLVDRGEFYLYQKNNNIFEPFIL